MSGRIPVRLKVELVTRSNNGSNLCPECCFEAIETEPLLLDERAEHQMRAMIHERIRGREFYNRILSIVRIVNHERLHRSP